MALNCKKYNRYGVTQDRIMVLTDAAFYLISSKKIHSKMLIKSLHYVIKTVHATSMEIIICFNNDTGQSNYIDVRLSMEKRDEFLAALKEQFKALVSDGTKYKVYGIPEKSLKDFRMGSHFEVEPD